MSEETKALRRELDLNNVSRAALRSQRDRYRTKLTEVEREKAELEARLGRAAEALNLALMHLEDERAIASVRAVLAVQEKEQQ